MTSSLIQNLLSTSPFKLVNSTTGEEVVKGIAISRINIKLTSTPLRHMKEDGSTIVDSRIIQPTMITIDAYCKDNDLLTQANDVAADRSNFYTMTSKGIVIDRLMADSEQIKQSPDVMSAAPIRLSFKQIIAKKIKPVVFAQSANSSVINRGIAIINSAKTTLANLYSSVVK